MWPFSPRQGPPRRYPAVAIGDIVAVWGENSGWEFVDPVLEVDCTLAGIDVFHEAIVQKLPLVRKWIAELNEDIGTAVREHADRGGLPVEGYDLQSIDVAALASEDTIDVCYTSEDWADYAVNVVISNGQIVELFGGD